MRDRFASFGIDNARLEPWGEFPVGFNRGPWFGRVVEPEPQVARVRDHGVVGGHQGGRPRQGGARSQGQERARRGQGQGDARRRLGAHAATGRLRPDSDPAFRRSLRKELEDAKAAGIVTASSSELLVTGGLHRISWDKLPTLPSVTLLRKQFDEIAGWLKDGKPVTLEFDIRNYFKKGPIKLYNVIADIPGHRAAR